MSTGFFLLWLNFSNGEVFYSLQTFLEWFRTIIGAVLQYVTNLILKT